MTTRYNSIHMRKAERDWRPALWSSLPCFVLGLTVELANVRVERERKGLVHIIHYLHKLYIKNCPGAMPAGFILVEWSNEEIKYITDPEGENELLVFQSVSSLSFSLRTRIVTFWGFVIIFVTLCALVVLTSGGPAAC